jgi:glutamate-1-semialdehyde 2,1-aminomutase
MNTLWLSLAALGALSFLPKVRARLLLSRAKHPSLVGHPRMARRLAKLVPAYTYDEKSFFESDEAPTAIVASRKQGFHRLAKLFRERAPKTLAATKTLENDISDVAFVNAYRVPFQYRDLVREHLDVGGIIAHAEGSRVCDLDGNWSYDLAGSYGVNVFGAEFYKQCIDRGVERARDIGLMLGPYHPVIAENVARLKRISGLDEVSFHMSGTEAVMQAVRLARYHTGRSHVVRFCGAYHGWSDGIQAGVGNPRPVDEIYTLREMHPLTLEVLRTRNDIACVLVNPIQAMHPNASPAADSSLVAGERSVSYDRAAYVEWLHDLREVCIARGIVLIFDEVFLGFRLALGGAQEYFGVRADMVTYGKTLGGGLPVGVVCGRHDLMRRFRDNRPVDICFARGTFNSHPYVMTTMNEFLRHLDKPSVLEEYERLDEVWDGRAKLINARLAERRLPVQFANMVSVWTTLYTQPGRYHWMFQYYLRAQGLMLPWIGTGRFIFSHALTDDDFEVITDRIIMAAEAMRADGWFFVDAALTAKAIKRRIVRETINALVGRRPSGQSAPPAEGQAEPCGTS